MLGGMSPGDPHDRDGAGEGPARAAAPLDDIDETFRAERREQKLVVKQAEASALVSAWDHSRNATDEQIRLHRETLETVKQIDAGARKNAETALFLSEA